MMYRPIFLFAIFCMLVSASCSPEFTAKSTPTVVPTGMPEPLQLINGVIDACLLLAPEEVEAVLGNQVTSEVVYPSGMTGCRYISVINGDVVLIVFVITDTTIQLDEASARMGIDSASDDYELTKFEDLRLAQKMPKLIKVEDIENLGDQAYMREWGSLDIHILNNDIYYEFNTLGSYNIGRDGLMKLAQIALQRMP